MTDLPRIVSSDDFEREVAPLVAPPFKSHFNAVPWSRLDEEGPKHEWLIKNILTRGEMAMLAGPSQSGKSFQAIDLCMAVARGIPWFGHKTMRGGVVYQAGESAKGVRRKRLPAYRKHHLLSSDDNIPFVLLQRPVDLYASDDHTNLMIEEILHWKKAFSPTPLELVVIDTFAAATPGANENAAEDVTRVLARCARINEATGAGILLVHHMNAAGEKPRGHTSIFANLDSVLICKKVDNASDDNGRAIREITIAKMKDGETETPPIRFVLPQVILGKDADGDSVTSCVVDVPARNSEAGEGKGSFANVPMTPDREVFLRAVYTAIQSHGEPPPKELPNVPWSARVVRWPHVKDAYEAKTFEGEGEDSEIKKGSIIRAIKRHGTHFLNNRIIGRETITREGGGKETFIWLTSRRVKGFPTPYAPGPERGGAEEQSPAPAEDEIPM